MNPHENYSSSSSSSSSTISDEEDDITDEQLQTLQSLVPNSTMGADKRSILEETHEYLQKMHEESERIEKEISQRSNNGRPSSSSSSVGQHGPKILSVEVEEMMQGESFVVKMSWMKGGNGSGGTGHVQRVINECCSDVTMTSTIVSNNNPNLMHTTAFVKVNEELKRTTEEELHDLLINTASRFGLLP